MGGPGTLLDQTPLAQSTNGSQQSSGSKQPSGSKQGAMAKSIKGSNQPTTPSGKKELKKKQPSGSTQPQKGLKKKQPKEELKKKQPKEKLTKKQPVEQPQKPTELATTQAQQPEQTYFKTWFVKGGRPGFELSTLQVDLRAGAIHETWISIRAPHS